MQLKNDLGYLLMRAKVFRKISYTRPYVADKDQRDKF